MEPLDDAGAPMSDPLVERLAALDTCVVSDALDRLGLRGAVHGIGRLWACPRVAGRVVTVALGPFQKQADHSAPHLGTRAIEAATSEHLIVVANAGRVQMAGWGGLLSLAARRRGVRAVIVDGACRDVDEAETLGFPLYARAAVPSTARGRAVELATNTTVTLGEISVAPGDLAIADGSGVVFVPAASAAEVLTTAEQLAAREAELGAQIERGVPATEVLANSYERLVARG
jgi:4-hydroxy-4-methyl-2-oxoglutarate aldolase